MLHMDIGAAEFAVMAAFHLAAQLGAHGHLAITDAQHGHAHLEHALRRARRVGVGDAGGPARKDDGARFLVQRGVRLVVRHDLAIDAGFADAPCDQLCDLAAEINDQNAHGVPVFDPSLALASRWAGAPWSSAVMAFWAAASPGSTESASL